MALTSFLKWGQPPAVVCSACCKMQHCQHTVFRAFPQTVSPRRTNLCAFIIKKLAILVESAIDGMLPYGYYRNTICTDTEGRTHDV